MRRYVHLSFAVIGLLGTSTYLYRPGLGGILIFGTMLAAFWSLSAVGEATKQEIILSQAFLLFALAGPSLGLFGKNLAGITFDSYLHLLAAFTITMLLVRLHKTKRLPSPFLWPFLLTMLLGIGVEAVQLLDELLVKNVWFSAGCWDSFCTYWQDTLKDLLNDALGSILYLIPLCASRRAPSEPGSRQPTQR